VALEHHPSLAFARGRRAEAGGRVRQVVGQKGIQLDLSSSYMRYDWLPPNKKNILGGGSTDIYSELAASQVLTTFGRIEGAIDAARAQELGEQEAFRRTAQNVVYQVRRAFYAATSASQVVAYYREAEAQMERHLEIARGLVEVGKAAPLDVLRAEVQLSNVRQALLRARNSEAQSRMALNNAMGRDAGTDLSIVPDDVTDLTAPPDMPVDRVLRSHPEARAAYLAVVRAEADLRSAKAGNAPTISARVSYNSEGGSDPLAVRNWNVGVVLALPLWDSGIRRGATDQAAARLQQAKSNLDLVKQRIDLDVSASWLSVGESRERIETTRKAVDQAAEALRVVQEKYRVGLGSSIEVIDAQTALTQARANWTQAVADFRTAVAQWALATGSETAEGVAK
jgi:outer membrane protein